MRRVTLVLFAALALFATSTPAQAAPAATSIEASASGETLRFTLAAGSSVPDYGTMKLYVCLTSRTGSNQSASGCAKGQGGYWKLFQTVQAPFSSGNFDIPSASLGGWQAVYQGKRGYASSSRVVDVASASPQIYWTSYSGSLFEFHAGAAGPTAIVTGSPALASVTADANHIYWTNVASGAIKRADRDGSNAVEIATGSQPSGAAVDGNYLYWTNAGDGSIWRCDLDTLTTSSFLTGVGAEAGVAVDSSHIYWINYHVGSIMRADLDGTDVETIVAGPLGTMNQIVATGDYLYWTRNGMGQIWRSNLDGTGAAAFITVTIESPAFGLAVDGSHIYWDEFASPYPVKMANLDGSNIVTLTNSPGQPTGMAVRPTISVVQPA